MSSEPAAPYEGWDPEEATEEQDMKPDAAIVPYVEALRKAGVTTWASCQGHIDEDTGEILDGFLWLEPEELTVEQAREMARRGRWITTDRAYGLFELWKVEFVGMSRPDAGRESLRRDMEVVFDVLDVELPEVDDVE